MVIRLEEMGEKFGSYIGEEEEVIFTLYQLLGNF